MRPFAAQVILVASLFATSTVGAEELDWDALKLPADRETFDESMIPESTKSLLDRPMSIRGYMIVSSVFSKTGIKRFAMWAETKQKRVDVSEWKKLPLHQMVYVEMADGTTADLFVSGPVKVTGTIVIDVLRNPDGTVATVYKILATQMSKARIRGGYHSVAGHGC